MGTGRQLTLHQAQFLLRIHNDVHFLSSLPEDSRIFLQWFTAGCVNYIPNKNPIWYYTDMANHLNNIRECWIAYKQTDSLQPGEWAVKFYDDNSYNLLIWNGGNTTCGLWRDEWSGSLMFTSLDSETTRKAAAWEIENALREEAIYRKLVAISEYVEYHADIDTLTRVDITGKYQTLYSRGEWR